MIKQVLFSFCFLFLNLVAQADQPPNIVLIMADDLGIDSVEDYGCLLYTSDAADE